MDIKKIEEQIFRVTNFGTQISKKQIAYLDNNLIELMTSKV